MLHPNEIAEDYIWNKFGDTYFSDHTLAFSKEWQALKQAISHRPFNVNSPQHQLFLKNTINKLEQLADTIDVNAEIESLKDQLK